MVVVPMPGNPGVVEAGATRLSSTAAAFTTAGEGVRASGGALGSAWTGGAASAAVGRIALIGSRAAIGAEVSRAAGTALTTYAAELRAAQEMFARGEAMLAAGRAAAATAAGQVQSLSTEAGPASMQRDVALTNAQSAVKAGEQQAADGQVLMDQAVAREKTANDAATTQVTAAHGQLAGMAVPTAGGGAAAVAPGAVGAPPRAQLPAAPAPAPAAPPEEEHTGFSLADLGHAALDVVGLIPVVGEAADGANALWYAAEGDYLNASLSAAAMIPLAGWAATGLKVGIKTVDAVGGLARTAEAVAPAVVKTGEAVPGAKLSADAARAIESSPSSAPGRPPSESAPVNAETTPAAQATDRSLDPVDLGSGLLFQPETDVALPGLLPLVLDRMHVSGYRSGRFFGPSWASTLDQVLEVGTDRVWFARADAHVLVFPAPEALPVVSSHTERWTLARDAETYLVTDLDTDRTLHFTGLGRLRWLTAVTDRFGHRIDVDRLADGTPLEVRHSGGYRVRVTTALDRIVGFDLLDAGPDGQPSALVRFGYTAGNLTAIVNSSNLPFRYGYDDRGRITGWVDRIGTWLRHAYDEHDRVVRQVSADDALSASYAYAGDVVEMTDALGHVSRYRHDAAGRIVRRVDACGGELRRTWEHGGRLSSVLDPLGRETRFSYDEFGALVGIAAPDGSTTTVDRDARGLPVRVVERDGAVWHHAYDERGLRTAVVDPAGARTTFTHDGRGGLASITDALGGRTLVACDAAGLPVAVTDPLGSTTRWERDAFGRVVTEIDATGEVTRHGWTLEGLPASTTTADGRTARTVYDGERNVVAGTDAAGHTTRFERTHFEVPSARIDPDGSRTEYAWDAQVRLVEVRNPQGLTWTYERDACGRVVAETDFNGRRHTSERDAAGQVVARRNALGQVTTFVHDRLGQVTEQRCDGALTTFDHDAAGRLVRATTPEVDLVLGRDVLGRVVSEAVNGRAVTSTFDALGRRTRRRTSTGQVSEWTHDAASRVSTLLAGVAIGFEYDAAGREIHRSAGAAVVAQEWGAEGLRSQTAGPVARRYSYRADGYLSAVAGTDARSVDLDVHGRVTGVHGRGWSERYAYDTAGNVTDAHWTGADAEVAGERTYRGTLLTRAGGVSYAHDGEGRVVRRTRRRLSRKPESWHYRWDALDRLVGVVTPDGARWRYVHDALGRRVSKVRLDRPEQVDFAWDGSTLVEQVSHGPDTIAVTTWDHDSSGLRPVAQRERVRRAGQAEIDERFLAVVADLVGAPTELLDLDGNIVGQARRSLWGRTTWTGSASTPLLFPGQYLDPETGFADNLHRQYDPDTARYASLDPLGLAPAPNPNTYVHNPHTWLDPLGLSNCPGGGADFIVDSKGQALPTGRSRMEHWTEQSSTSSSPLAGGKGTEHALNDGNHVRIMEAAGSNPPRASFTGPDRQQAINPFTGQKPQPPLAPKRPPGANPPQAAMDAWHSAMEAHKRFVKTQWPAVMDGQTHITLK